MTHRYKISFKEKAYRKNGNIHWKKRTIEIPFGSEIEAFLEIQNLLAQGKAIEELTIVPDPSRRFPSASKEDMIASMEQFFIFLGKGKFWQGLSVDEKLKAIHFQKTNNELWKALDDNGKLRMLGRKIEA